MAKSTPRLAKPTGRALTTRKTRTVSQDLGDSETRPDGATHNSVTATKYKYPCARSAVVIARVAKDGFAEDDTALHYGQVFRLATCEPLGTPVRTPTPTTHTRSKEHACSPQTQCGAGLQVGCGDAWLGWAPRRAALLGQKPRDSATCAACRAWGMAGRPGAQRSARDGQHTRERKDSELDASCADIFALVAVLADDVLQVLAATGGHVQHDAGPVHTVEGAAREPTGAVGERRRGGAGAHGGSAVPRVHEFAGAARAIPATVDTRPPSSRHCSALF